MAPKTILIVQESLTQLVRGKAPRHCLEAFPMNPVRHCKMTGYLALAEQVTSGLHANPRRRPEAIGKGPWVEQL